MADGLWRIHGKAYDFSSFAVNHPGNARAHCFHAIRPTAACFGSVVSSGGKHWIELTKGLDITDLFEVHHLNFDKASAVLPKYYVKVKHASAPAAHRDAAVKDDAVSTCCYSWTQGDFYSTLRSKLKLLIPQHGPTTQFTAACFATLALWTVFWSLAVARGSFCFALAAGWMMHALMGIGLVHSLLLHMCNASPFTQRPRGRHNCFHGNDSLWTNVFDFCGFSHVIWRISHAISHHTYPNSETDFEASTIEPFINFMTNKPRNSPLVFLYMHPFMALASTIDFFSRSVLIFRKRFPLTANHFFPVFVWLSAVIPNGFAQGTLLTLTMQVSRNLMLAPRATFLFRAL